MVEGTSSPFGTQFKFMLSEEGLNNVVKEVATSSNDISELTARFLADWGGVQGINYRAY